MSAAVAEAIEIARLAQSAGARRQLSSQEGRAEGDQLRDHHRRRAPEPCAGNIEWPSRLPGNPATDFVVRDAAYLDSEKDFVKT